MNQRRLSPTDLQSVPFSHSGTPPCGTAPLGPTGPVVNERASHKLLRALQAWAAKWTKAEDWGGGGSATICKTPSRPPPLRGSCAGEGRLRDYPAVAFTRSRWPGGVAISPRPQHVTHATGYTARGRISVPSRHCSSACAIHPTVRPTANRAKAAPVGRRSRCSTITSAKSMFGADPGHGSHRLDQSLRRAACLPGATAAPRPADRRPDIADGRMPGSARRAPAGSPPRPRVGDHRWFRQQGAHLVGHAAMQRPDQRSQARPAYRHRAARASRPPRAWHRSTRSARGPPINTSARRIMSAAFAPTPQAAASRTCIGRVETRTTMPAQARRRPGDAVEDPHGIRQHALRSGRSSGRPSPVPPSRQCNVPLRRLPTRARGQAALMPDPDRGSASICHSNAATSSSVAVADERNRILAAILQPPALDPRDRRGQDRLAPAYRRGGNGTAAAAPAVALGQAVDVGRVVQAAARFVGRGGHTDAPSADIGVERLAGHAKLRGGLLGGQPARRDGDSSSDILILLDQD